MKRGRGGLQTRQPGWGGLKSIEGAREEIICRKFQRETQVQNPEAGTGLVSFKEQRGKYWGWRGHWWVMLARARERRALSTTIRNQNFFSASGGFWRGSNMIWVIFPPTERVLFFHHAYRRQKCHESYSDWTKPRHEYLFRSRDIDTVILITTWRLEHRIIKTIRVTGFLREVILTAQ